VKHAARSRPWSPPGSAFAGFRFPTEVIPNIPVEDVAATMGTLIAEGKIGGWGQSQATAEQIRRAHAVTPLTAVQSGTRSWSECSRRTSFPPAASSASDSPFQLLASGFLSGKITADVTYTAADVRRVITRFDLENVRANQALLDQLTDFAALIR
jgi:aryl-alcohol dehydrogenase-like predicted oxidoreductase